MGAVRKHGPTPVSIWRIINVIANARQPDSRAQRRRWRLRYLGAIHELLHGGVLFRHGAFIATTEFATIPLRGPA
jgi:hypothetical protein